MDITSRKHPLPYADSRPVERFRILPTLQPAPSGAISEGLPFPGGYRIETLSFPEWTRFCFVIHMTPAVTASAVD